MNQLNRVDVDTFKSQEKSPLIIVLDNVRSLHNVGSAFRTGDAFSVEKIILCGITGTPPHREIEKTALGATQSVKWEYHENIENTIKSLKSEGYKIYSIEQTNDSISLEKFEPTIQEKYALIFGNEVHGVQEEAIKESHGTIEIPQFGTKHSFNVSVTIGIILWDFVNKIKFIEK